MPFLVIDDVISAVGVVEAIDVFAVLMVVGPCMGGKQKSYEFEPNQFSALYG